MYVTIKCLLTYLHTYLLILLAEVEALSRELFEAQSGNIPSAEEQLEATTGQLEKALRKLVTEHKQRQAAEDARDKAMEERR